MKAFKRKVMGKITANITTIRNLPFDKFNLPPYQRPYRWKKENVEKLLDCIQNNINKSQYRIGSIILNTKDGKLDIVDGQQRLTTLSLVFLYLENNTSYCLRCHFNHIESKQNIYKNYRIIGKWIENNFAERKAQLKDFILNRCSVVVITVEDLNEAFQMFDSQNGRGKELEAYNLLKAYHLRAIDSTSNRIELSQNKILIDKKWEAAVLDTVSDGTSLLKYVINTLYRTRLWNRKTAAYEFNKQHVSEFKGIQINNKRSDLPLNNKSLLIYLYSTGCLKMEGNVCFKKRSERNYTDQNPLVSIDMDIINGTLFFEYIQTFVSSYDYLFRQPVKKGDVLYRFRKDFERYCLNYGGAYRAGDSYIRDVYIAMIIAVYDRFGEEYVDYYYRYVYALVYRNRLEKMSVYYDTMAKYPMRYVSIIENAKGESDMSLLKKEALADIQCRKLTSNEEDIARFIVQNIKAVKIVCETNELTIRDKQLAYGHVITKEDF